MTSETDDPETHADPAPDEGGEAGAGAKPTRRWGRRAKATAPEPEPVAGTDEPAAASEPEPQTPVPGGEEPASDDREPATVAAAEPVAEADDAEAPEAAEATEATEDADAADDGEASGDGETPDKKRRWLAEPLAKDDPRRAKRRKANVVFFTSIAVVILLVFALVRFLAKPSDGPRVITDQGFIQAATKMCKDVLPTLRPPDTKPNEVLSPQQTGDAAAKAAAGIAHLAADIGAIDIEDTAQDDARRQWMADWQLYSFVGQKYADLLKAGKVADAQRIARTGTSAYLRADKFARANGLSSCQFYVLLRAPQNSGDSYF